MPNEQPHAIEVTSHVGRDVLAQAAQFRTEFSVIWEYVANSLQYVDNGVSPRVEVRVGRDLVTISDNGSGMDVEGLRHYFTMHGENLERMQGRAGRGKWGTGKSAAFGIASELRVDTVKAGRRNAMSLSREAIEASPGTSIPIQWDVRDETVDAANGTTITIADIHLPRIDKQAVIEYIERHLSAFRGTHPQVVVNGTECRYREPEFENEFRFAPSAKQMEKLGDIELVVKASRTPLKAGQQGIAVLAGHGNLLAFETGGIEHKEYGNYLFGEIDVPALESYESPLQATDPSRNMTLNPRHPVVATLQGFIGSKLEQVRKDLLEAQKGAREAEEARRLEQHAHDIADILNDDFKTQSKRLRDLRTAVSRPGAASAAAGGASAASDATDVWIEGLDVPGISDDDRAHAQSSNPGGRPDPQVPRSGSPDPGGSSLVSPAGGDGKRRRPSGGFAVDHKHLGADEHRSHYDANTMSILINLDHPVVSAALREEGPDSVSFRRLSYEIAFTEYALALSYEMVNRDPQMPADDVLYDVRYTLQRISRAAAALYGPAV